MSWPKPALPITFKLSSMASLYSVSMALLCVFIHLRVKGCIWHTVSSHTRQLFFLPRAGATSRLCRRQDVPFVVTTFLLKMLTLW
ncbi:hypothetical protein B0T25DRAFT_58888 [Lasiosphaeria hispida]|uniref:Uncharacterized protein n=1 Tax=Lasiosphaeria hispida TaxID=260671 RepID=A0AAJ0HWU8_9PEZI|nr:hypothetical protein B0T25DRAFT_58888 [Lasiosphaeria hispida]